MANDLIPQIEKILDTCDESLRISFGALDLAGLEHLILAITPDGDGIIRCSCPPEALREIAAMLIEIADEVGAGEARH